MKKTFINAKIYTFSDCDYIENAYLQIDNDSVVCVGDMKDYTITGDETDLSGKIITPGFIDAHSHIGLWEDALGFEGSDGNEQTDPVTPNVRAIDAVNPFDRCFSEAVNAGVTSVCVTPGSANPIAGQISLIKTSGKIIDNMITCENIGMKFAFGENPKTVYNEKNQAPMTRMAVASIIRNELMNAKKYMEDKLKAQTDEDFDEPDYCAKSESLMPLLKGEIKAHIHAHRADDIATAIRIFNEFNIKYIIVHATEGHLITEHLKQNNVDIITGPIICDRSKPELKNLELFAYKKMIDAGLLVAICTDHPVIPSQYLALSAYLTQKCGVKFIDALKAITINSAKILNMQDKIGCIKKGVDADFVVFNSNPLDFLSDIEAVYIKGVKIK